MASAGEADHSPTPPSVFLSYASEDRAAARALRDALAAAGLEVWYDESELGGGDEWDQKIRRQIRECDYFMPVISAKTQARNEGYFRREWRLAVDRTLDMADGHLFLIPVVIDGTDQASARVPDRFVSVQWLKVPNGQSTPALQALCSRLIAGEEPPKLAPKRQGARAQRPGSEPAARALPEFPLEEPGQKVKFWFHVVGWAGRSGWILFQRLPRWMRLIVYFWLFVVLISRGCSHSDESEKASAAKAAKLKDLSTSLQGVTGKADIGRLGADIARAIVSEDGDAPSERSRLLAIPFSAGSTDGPAGKLADSTFALLYGRLAISHEGRVGLSKEPLASLEPHGVAERGRSSHSLYVLCGGIENREGISFLTVDFVEVSDGSVVWTKSYPAATSDPATVAADIETHVPSLDEN